ncbi:MAG: nucleotidyltransferase domain-containing protein [Methanomassiliicoccales archaeon]|nr:MAG: nucleotidyltransferase domain-containing protein [Methanomassiliicoccales archaeon]
MRDAQLRIQDLDLSNDQKNFLLDLIPSLQRDVGERVISVILFGSAVKGGFSKEVSDFDMIIVVDDDVSSRQVSVLDSKVQSLVEKHGIASSTAKGFKGIPQFIMAQTGMFTSQFICRRRDFISGTFTRIFSANPLLAKLLSPSGQVLGGVLKGSKTVHGEDLASEVKVAKPTNLDVMKSLIMNELLVGLSLFYYPLTENATKLAMEATKWSAHMAGYMTTGESKSLAEAVEVLASKGISLDHLKRLEKLRRNYGPDLSFIFSAPKAIAGIHLSLLEGPREYH